MDAVCNLEIIARYYNGWLFAEFFLKKKLIKTKKKNIYINLTKVGRNTLFLIIINRTDCTVGSYL